MQVIEYFIAQFGLNTENYTLNIQFKKSKVFGVNTWHINDDHLPQ